MQREGTPPPPKNLLTDIVPALREIFIFILRQYRQREQQVCSVWVFN